MTATVTPLAPISQTWTYFNGNWGEGNVAIMGPRTHAAWLGSTVFDGARWFEGKAPDLDRHLVRVNRSAVSMGMKALTSEARWAELVYEGAAKFAPDAALYIRPMYWAEAGGAGGGVRPDPDSTRWRFAFTKPRCRQSRGPPSPYRPI